MTLTLAMWVALAAFAWLGLLGVLVYALRQRWFAHFENGFFLSTVVALVGIALMAASVVGVWGFLAAKQILDQELIVELQDVGGVVESEIRNEIADVEAQLTGLGGSLADALADHAPMSDLQERMRTAQSFNNRCLQLRLLDANGVLITATTKAASGEVEPINRIAVGFNLAGKPFVSDAYYSPTFSREMLHISLPIYDRSKHVQGMISARFDLRAELGALIRGSRFNQSGYAVVVDGEGQIIGHPDDNLLERDVSSYAAVQSAWRSGGIGEVRAPNNEGKMRLFVYRAMENPGTLAKRPWVLLTEIDQSEEMAPIKKLSRSLALGVGLLLIATLLVAHRVSRSIQQPLESLSGFAKRIGGGDLAGRSDVAGRDVAGRLAGTLNDMAAGLQERDHVKEVFGRYIATQVSDKILKGQANLGGESRRVSILFSDIRNFTGMSEQMTPQQVVAFLNDYFSEMVDAVFEQNGLLDKFLGDGLMAIFGAFGDDHDHPQRSVLAALRMQALLAKINGERAMSGKAPIAIGIGIHTDDVILGNIGSRKRLEYTVVGDGVNTSSRLQGLNKEFGTTILISETTYEAVKDDFICRPMPDAQLRGKVRELKFYEVVSVKAAAAAV
jgi:class 3 adenylate cyclase